MKRKKLYYIPGLISIIGLPILFLFIGSEDPVITTCLKVFIPKDENTKLGASTFSNYMVRNMAKKKKMISVSFDDFVEFGNDWDGYVQDTKMSFIQHEIERLQFTNDTSSVLKIEFNDGSTYGQFAWLLNQAMLYDVKRFALVDNEFYLFANEPPVHYQSLDLLFPIDTTSIIVDPKYAGPTKWEIFKWKLSYKLEEVKIMAKGNYLLITGFLLFIFIPFIIKMIRRNKNIVHVTVTA